MARAYKNTVDKQEVYDYLMTKPGMTDIKAKGIMANIQAESEFYSDAKEPNVDNPGIGLFQHTYPARKAAFKEAVPDWETNWKGQIDFAMEEDEMKGYMAKDFESTADSTEYFMKTFENPKDQSQAAIDGRVAHVDTLGIATGPPVTVIDPIDNPSVLADVTVEARGVSGTYGDWSKVEPKAHENGDIVKVGNKHYEFQSERNTYAPHNIETGETEDLRDGSASLIQESIVGSNPERLPNGRKNPKYRANRNSDGQYVYDNIAQAQRHNKEGKLQEGDDIIINGKHYKFDKEGDELVEFDNQGNITNTRPATATTVETVTEPEVVTPVVPEPVVVNPAIPPVVVEEEEEGITIPEPNVSAQDGTDLNSTNVEVAGGQRTQVRDAEIIDNGDGTFTRSNEDGTQEIVVTALDAEGNTIYVPQGEGTPVPEGSTVENIPLHPSQDLDVDGDNIPDVVDSTDDRVVVDAEDDDYNDEEIQEGLDQITLEEETAATVPTETAGVDTTPEQQGIFNNALGSIGDAGGSLLKGGAALLDSIGGPGAIISYVMGKKGLKEAMKEIKPQASAELSPMFMQHLRQSRELAKKGFHPDEAKLMQKELDGAYQMGLENAVRGSGGQRATFLAQSGVLDSQRSSALLEYAAKDADLQRKNADKYEKLIMFKENFDIQQTEKERAEDMARQVANKDAAAEFTSAAFTNVMSGLGGGVSSLLNKQMGSPKQFLSSIQNLMNNTGTTGTNE